MANDDVGNVFAIPDFWKTSRWLNLARPGKNEFFSLDLKAADKTEFSKIGKRIAEVRSEEFFKVPTALEPLNPNVSEELPSIVLPATVSRKRSWDDIDLFDGASIRDHEAPVSTAGYKSWDGFVMPDIPPVEPLFITEAGPSTYDAALDSADDPLGLKNGSHHVVETHPYILALLALAMGRASIFFTWSKKIGSFVQDLDALRISGYSADVLLGLQTRCLQCGNISRFLQVFVQITYKTHPSAGRVALAKAVDTLLLVVQTKLGGQVKKIGSLLQLQSLVYPVYTILDYFNSMVAKLNKARTDEQMLSVLFAETQALEHGDELLRDIMREVLARVSEPWLDFAQKWMGLNTEDGNPMTKDGPGKSFVKVEDVAYVDDFGLENEEVDYVLDERRVPGFFPEDITQVMFETGKNLRLLRTHHAEHPLCSILESIDPPSLEWHYDWNSIQELQEKVNKYETTLLQTIRRGGSCLASDARSQRHLSHAGYSLQLFGRAESQLAEQLVASIKELNQPLPVASVADRLSQLLHSRLFEDENSKESAGLDLAPHWSLLPLLSFGPLVQAQARLINREYMKLLFTSHKLRDHIRLQKDFQLLGSGLFCSRLSHALFDSDLETAERQAGVARNGGVMGLRLGSRDTWPPASSELRLALMGVLTESYSPAPKQAAWRKGQSDLPGDLSFAVRDLSDEEIEKCLNPGSLEALDFLRLSYKPPAQLAPVMTPMVLVKYDKIFKLLLRILRMLYVASELSQDLNGRTSRWQDVSDVALRFRTEAQHFISSITTYFFDTGIGLQWKKFESWLDQVQTDIENDDLADQRASVASPDNVRKHHEQVLDSIMHTLLLRKRQQPVLKVLEDIFTFVLKFSHLARLEALGKLQTGHEDHSVAELYTMFKSKVDVFITVCRGLSERKGHNVKPAKNDVTNDVRKHGTEENTIDRLLLRLEMSGYYGGTRYEHM
ncbi:Spc97/Spc98 family protein [Seiridium cupressi]